VTGKGIENSAQSANILEYNPFLAFGILMFAMFMFCYVDVLICFCVVMLFVLSIMLAYNIFSIPLHTTRENYNNP